MAQIPLSGQLFNLVEAFHTHQLAAETTQRAAADTAAAKVPHFFSGFRPQKGGAGTHRHNYAGGLTGQSQRTGAAGLKFIHPAGGQAEHIPIHIAGANAGQNDPAHISEGETVAGQVVAQCAVQAGDLILTSMACFLSKGGRQVRDMQKPAAVLVMIGEQRCLVNVYL